MGSYLIYSPTLDSLRAFAIILVLFSHTSPSIIHAGWIGVEIFFILSGYLITGSLITAKNYKKFYLNRAARIFPALFVFLIFYLLVSIIFNIKTDAFLLVSIFLFFCNWLFALDIYQTSYLTHLWSLALEEQFYLIYPWLIIIFIKKPKFLLGLIVFLFLYKIHMFQIEYAFSRLYYATDVRASSFVLGGLLYFIHSQKISFKHVNLLLNTKQFLSIFSLIFIICASFMDVGRDIKYWLFFSNITVAILILYAYDQKNWINILLNNKILIYIGKLSFALYLWHYPIFRYLRVDLELYPLMVFIIGFPIALLFSFLSYFYIEKPILQRVKGN